MNLDDGSADGGRRVLHHDGVRACHRSKSLGAWSHLDDRATPIVVPFRAESSPRLLMRTRQHLRWRITEYEEVINGLPEGLQELVVVCRPRYATFAGHRSASQPPAGSHATAFAPIQCRLRLWAIGPRA